ncbi:MAG: MFS transporter [Candidatus Hydrogenedentes bacterium]|nr:MFS transporter [Candidatus Hydrogenedentota bacterium]
MNDWTPAERHMRFRFSLYGFLKNQRYFEAFWILAFLDKGFSFFEIGMLVGFRSLCTNLLEVPSGAVADSYGRRASMVLSFLAYIVAFVTFAWSEHLSGLFLGMFFMAIGEAFRSGTHKAIIFDWLRSVGRESERVQVYGYTRSWSKMGSALSALLAAGLVFFLQDYGIVFWLSALPCVVNIVNFLGYPASVEASTKKRAIGGVGALLWHAAVAAWKERRQRRLLLEAMGFEGVFTVGKDYLQPFLQQAALALPVLLVLADTQRTALIVGIVYSLLFFLSGVASRNAHSVVQWKKNEEDAARFLWQLTFACYGVLLISLYMGWAVVAIPAFVGLYLIQNLWRPALVSRLNAVSDPSMSATTLSIESQARSLATFVMAPLLGLAVDAVGLWPVGALGAVVALIALSATRRRRVDMM